MITLQVNSHHKRHGTKVITIRCKLIPASGFIRIVENPLHDKPSIQFHNTPLSTAKAVIDLVQSKLPKADFHKFSSIIKQIQK